MCGEKGSARRALPLVAGSPPHVRGKESEKPDCDDKRRITPAYAGKRLEKKYKEIESEDHPRVCGEKTKKIP